jgi:HEAT repeat protein
VSDPSAAELVGYLADPHRRTLAYRQLLQLGAGAGDAVRLGLRHPDPQVRAQCCRVLDHVMDAASAPALMAALEDPAQEVRIQALHALACDRCKEGSWHPPAEVVLPAALKVLRDDPSARVRAMAAELVAAWADTHPAAAAALAMAATADCSTSVRKKASWYLPGGSIHRRTHPFGNR